ncbi:MAG: hypothetical protein AAFP69_05110 [Planctomycetota bacterium]
MVYLTIGTVVVAVLRSTTERGYAWTKNWEEVIGCILFWPFLLLFSIDDE